MARLGLIPVLFIVACFFAGSYGALHNQISYTVSSEYFTKFKFHQFNIADSIPDRIGASIVGWRAAWWMGIVIGIILIPAGLTIRGMMPYFGGMIRVFSVVTITTMVFGLGALVFAYFTIDPKLIGDVTTNGHEISNDAAFLLAGTMHNFSYLGGMAGIITGALSIYWCCCRQTDERRRNEPESRLP